MKKRNIAFILLSVVALLAVAALLAPWKQWIESRIKTELSARGLDNIQFSVSSLGFEGITFKDISFGPDVSLRVSELTLDYFLSGLLQGQLRDLRVGEIKLETHDIKIRLRKIGVHFLPAVEGNTWQGEWNIDEVETQHTPLLLPLLTGTGTWGVKGNVVAAQGRFKSADSSHNASFNLHYFLDDSVRSMITIESASLPWNGGMLSTRNAGFSLAAKRASHMTLEVKHVSLDALMQLLTDKRATATGALSGTVPVVIDANGNVMFDAGSLKAEESGTIKLAADAIPGDNPQVELVREVLKNFHYRQFSMAIDSGKDKKLSILLSLLGNNPDAYNGREVKLNVRLNGDLLNLLQQGIVPLIDQKQLWKQDKNVKK